MQQVRFRLYFFLLALLVVMAAGTFGFMIAEDKPIEDAFYFCIVTISTVGYGDIHPVTPLGKTVSVLLIITGVGTFLGMIANATEVMLNRREQKARLARLNVVVGLFFSEIGSKLLRRFSEADPQIDSIRKDLVVDGKWTVRVFADVNRRLESYDYKVDISKMDLEDLRFFFDNNKTLLMRIMENPNLHEHGNFTHLLMAVSHLREELAARGQFSQLPDTDLNHLRGDMQRAYRHLVLHWLGYLQHLKEHYPYLFSLAVRSNPFDRHASPIVGL